jgi:hypothetical protein
MRHRPPLGRCPGRHHPVADTAPGGDHDRATPFKAHPTLSLLMGSALAVAALAGYMGILLVRQGPPSSGDTTPLTSVTTSLSNGDLHAAADVASLPNPPGYALLASPLVVLFRPFIGSPTWCTTAGRAAALRHNPALRHQADFANEVGECGYRLVLPDGRLGAALPPWYRAQGILGVLAWMMLVAGSWSLLRASRAARRTTEVALVVFLVILPSASSAIVQLFHPQDLLSLGFSTLGLALLLRRRWVPAGLLFGVAFLTKQFAVLVLVPALVAAPDWRARGRVLVPAVAVVAAGLLPFLSVAPRATLENVSGIGSGGAVAGATVLSITHVSSTVASAVARDFPVGFALLVSLWARRRRRSDLLSAAPLLGLVLACLASRLVFESVIFPYYLLAASVVFLLLDLAMGRVPDRSLAWIAATALFVALHPANKTVDALGTLILAMTAVACGLIEIATPPGPEEPGLGAQLGPGGGDMVNGSPADDSDVSRA